MENKMKEKIIEYFRFYAAVSVMTYFIVIGSIMLFGGFLMSWFAWKVLAISLQWVVLILLFAAITRLAIKFFKHVTKE
jgi:hypothetical protein